MTRPTRAPSLTWAEGRRQRAWALHQQGWSNAPIARALGVSAAAVGQWVARACQQGEEALAPRRRFGQGARLTEEQKQHLLGLLEQGPEAHGFFGPLWTGRRIAAVIARHFTVASSPNHVRKLMHLLRWSFQKATVQARQRNEPAIEDWFSITWPAIRRRAESAGGTLVFVDEAGFSM